MLTTALAFFIILSILVLIHELGHFLVARFLGVKVEEFGLGLPPQAISRKIKGTIYSLNWLPIGGFVRLAGEDEEEKKQQIPASKTKEYFFNRSKKERAAILSAGVVMNFILATVITAFLLTQGVLEPSGRVRVTAILPGTPAELSGLRVEDVLLSVSDSAATVLPQELKTSRQLINFIQAHKGQPVTLLIKRGDADPFPLVATPRVEYPKGEGALGVSINDLETKVYSPFAAPLKAVQINLSRAWEMLSSLGALLYRLVTLQSPQADVAGPIGIAQVTGQAVKFGWKAVLEFMSILSLNLAVLNIMPFPALDGGRLLFVFLEKILGKKVKPAFEKSTHQIGMIILFVLIALITYNDILRLARGG